MSFELYIAGVNELPAEDFDNLINNISDYRKTKLNSYKFEQDKKLCLLSTLLLDHALKKYGFEEKHMKYSTNAYGKPFFINAALYFSISHSGDYAMVVISDKQIGCDIQQIKEVNIKIADRFFSPAEQEYIKNTDDFFKIWTLKESLIKAVGKGLAIPLNAFTIEGLGNKEPYCEYEGEKYIFKEYNKINGYCISVCEKINSIL